MRHLAVLLLGTCLFVFGCGGDAGTGAATDATDDGASTETIEVAANCPDCDAVMVAGKCPT